MKKILLSLSTIAAVAAIVVGGTMSYFSDTATSTGNTFTSGTMDLKLSNDNNNYGDDVTETWNVSNMVPGGTPYVSTLYMKNTGSVDADYLKFVTKDTNMSPSTMDYQVRITKLEYAGKSLLTGGAGADLSNYVAPTYCDVKVNLPGGTYHTISGAVFATDDGKVICVGPGNYNDNWEKATSGAGGDGTGFPIAVNKSITLVSMEGPDTTTITAPGTNAINIEANDVTIKGFTIIGADYGIDIEGATGVVVKDNIIKNYSKEGIWMNGGSATIANNIIKANDNGIPSNSYSVDSIYTENSAVATIDHNNLENNKYGPNAHRPSGDRSTAAGIAAHTSSNITATYNVIGGNDFGIQIKQMGVTMAANYNDILGNTKDFFFEADNACTPSDIFNAENNWWGDFIPANHVSVASKCTNPISSIVDYTNYAGGPFVGYINGKDYNGNHFADLNDFYGVTSSSHDNNPLVIKNPDLKKGGANYHTLIMGVQLDGPTTGNAYQGGNVLTNMTVTMGQGPAN